MIAIIVNVPASHEFPPSPGTIELTAVSHTFYSLRSRPNFGSFELPVTWM